MKRKTKAMCAVLGGGGSSLFNTTVGEGDLHIHHGPIKYLFHTILIFSVKSFKDLYSPTDKQSANNTGSAAYANDDWWECR